MKRKITVILLSSCIGITGCTAKNTISENDMQTEQNIINNEASVASGAVVTVNDLVVEINGTSYDMAELCGPGLVNAITDVSEFGDYVVVQGHINPSRSFYGVFNTDAQKQQYFYVGGCLTWDENWEQLDDPVESVIYAEQNGPDQEAIHNWKEDTIATVELEEGEYIRGLSRTGNDITISICTVEGGRRELSFECGTEERSDL